ncbi:PREDICTED: glutamyl-tRNA(Gln) amidotransferase subunit C-4, mitochondrial [Eufriesea mexicana]|uniref:glutamyl-tRNA(Gln) amidotransferase subunit C-4, mitochondrial n=1 Tax=Eufriesea mexicana TaxID=516756 RepID=UPI00083C1A87|nr:PREDICTED: glutamyl-tRNA(Gln) amidotransferase subunit C-4, mitochondrial [Eufriesea mexicana]
MGTVSEKHLRNTKIDDIEPMYSPLEKESVPLRNDSVESITSRQEILMNAAIVEEEYFIAPVQTITKTL